MTPLSETARERFGQELRRCREHAGFTQQRLARTSLLSQAYVSAVERGAKGITEENVRRLDEALNTGGVLLTRWRDGRKRTADYAVWFANIVDVEAQATLIRQYHPTLIPGLLQTPEYAKVITRSGIPLDSDAEIDGQVEARIKRQKILTSDNAPWYQVVLDEPWLHRPTGGREIMRQQLEHLITMSRMPRVTIQVIPTNTEYHAGHDGPFMLLTVPEKGQIAYTETRTSGHPVDDPEVIDDYTRVFSELRGSALPAGASRDLLKRIAEEFQ